MLWSGVISGNRVYKSRHAVNQGDDSDTDRYLSELYCSPGNPPHNSQTLNVSKQQLACITLEFFISWPGLTGCVQRKDGQLDMPCFTLSFTLTVSIHEKEHIWRLVLGLMSRRPGLFHVSVPCSGRARPSAHTTQGQLRRVDLIPPSRDTLGRPFYRGCTLAFTARTPGLDQKQTEVMRRDFASTPCFGS
ncbi:hypothetical protein IAQ61_006113 [Plenodomus lingam]|uniref:uncharacterized protein n=1 Tax=Leptosphaeria maculans TaxID=5022 RepID=UPI0033343197|nr:hypothetical protein IAQ61_006113 [Plenodomus lingam]